ncbi:uncharacterized protein LOC125493342 isoform X2 [Beta vulgaris subsp. vulgaris]|uniref:uncharacterized protein LOC125493342 isoform X2 n=1 Tax=Beta vulgaris subsp. vulgaris TaxID=3555 RepID=UPI002546B091|nr:uncharacterized protein LOC125493342 isoform X2 [Beta vulgaris subsp. vulgaris]
MFAYNIGGSRPIIGVDGAHLRGPYSGILLTVVGKDGKNNIYPVAWAFVETKFSETLSWFLELLRNDIISVADSVTWIHEQDEFTYMSDRQNYFKGLIDAFRRVMHSADTRYCCRHFWTNFKAKLFSEIYKEQFWKARSSTKITMDKIKALNEDAFKYLQDIPICHWSMRMVLVLLLSLVCY